MPVDEPADHGEEQNNEARSKGRDEEPKFRLVGLPPGDEIAGRSNGVKKEQCGESHRGIEVGAAKMLQNIDDDLVSGRTGVEASDAYPAKLIRMRPFLREKEARANAYP